MLSSVFLNSTNRHQFQHPFVLGEEHNPSKSRLNKKAEETKASKEEVKTLKAAETTKVFVEKLSIKKSTQAIAFVAGKNGKENAPPQSQSTAMSAPKPVFQHLHPDTLILRSTSTHSQVHKKAVTSQPFMKATPARKTPSIQRNLSAKAECKLQLQSSIDSPRSPFFIPQSPTTLNLSDFLTPCSPIPCSLSDSDESNDSSIFSYSVPEASSELDEREPPLASLSNLPEKRPPEAKCLKRSRSVIVEDDDSTDEPLAKRIRFEVQEVKATLASSFDEVRDRTDEYREKYELMRVFQLNGNNDGLKNFLRDNPLCLKNESSLLYELTPFGEFVINQDVVNLSCSITKDYPTNIEHLVGMILPVLSNEIFPAKFKTEFFEAALKKLLEYKAPYCLKALFESILQDQVLLEDKILWHFFASKAGTFLMLALYQEINKDNLLGICKFCFTVFLEVLKSCPPYAVDENPEFHDAVGKLVKFSAKYPQAGIFLRDIFKALENTYPHVHGEWVVLKARVAVIEEYCQDILKLDLNVATYVYKEFKKIQAIPTTHNFPTKDLLYLMLRVNSGLKVYKSFLELNINEKKIFDLLCEDGVPPSKRLSQLVQRVKNFDNACKVFPPSAIIAEAEALIKEITPLE